MSSSQNLSVDQKASYSLGISSNNIHQALLDVICNIKDPIPNHLDIGCGTGELIHKISKLDKVQQSMGMDLINYNNSIPNFIKQDLNKEFELEHKFELITCTEVIEHLENPRHFLRQLASIMKPGGSIILTTPNLNSLASIFSFVLRGHHQAFGPRDYPAHITPIGAYDLRLIIQETTGLELELLQFIPGGRIPLGPWHFPRFLKGKFFSDNYLVSIKAN